MALSENYARLDSSTEISNKPNRTPMKTPFTLVFALALPMLSLAVDDNPQGFVCPGYHKYSPQPPDGYYPCVSAEREAGNYSTDPVIRLASWKAHAKCQVDELADWTEHQLTFTNMGSSSAAREREKLLAQLRAAQDQLAARDYQGARSNVVKACNRVIKLVNSRKVVCAQGEDIVYVSFDTVATIDHLSSIDH